MITPYSSGGQLLDKARRLGGPQTTHDELLSDVLALNSNGQVTRGECMDIANQVICERDKRSSVTVPSNGQQAIETFTAESLMSMDFPEIIWVVPELLPTGAALLAGKPKFGKSWLALGLCAAVGYGGKALSTWDVAAAEALYIALEDPPRRLKSRLLKLLEGEQRLPRCHRRSETVLIQPV